MHRDQVSIRRLPENYLVKEYKLTFNDTMVA